MTKLKDCTCVQCVMACKRTPGWFAPGEVEKAAKLKKMTTEAFRKKYIIIDYYIGDHREIDIPAPRKVGIETDRTRASWGYAFDNGTCVFLENDRCGIHEAKPYECRVAMLCDKTIVKGDETVRDKLAKMWEKHEDSNSH
jgi:Fe-S-cluster containining protein